MHPTLSCVVLTVSLVTMGPPSWKMVHRWWCQHQAMYLLWLVIGALLRRSTTKARWRHFNPAHHPLWVLTHQGAAPLRTSWRWTGRVPIFVKMAFFQTWWQNGPKTFAPKNVSNLLFVDACESFSFRLKKGQKCCFFLSYNQKCGHSTGLTATTSTSRTCPTKYQCVPWSF